MLNIRALSIAPMLKWTDTHFRTLLRLICPSAYLYTEMVTTGAILFGNQDKHLKYNEMEHPLALQLGGSDPKALAECAKIAAKLGYDEINLNVGCPSDRVQAGAFGVCLMREPVLVADCVNAMKAAVNIPVTVKTRIGVDHEDSYEFLVKFTEQVSEARADALIVHARKAWLKGLNPKENRTIPPLDYARVYQLKRDFDHLPIIINGGINAVDDAVEQLKHVDGVMIGRAAYDNPMIIAEMAKALGLSSKAMPIPDPMSIIKRYRPYMAAQLALGVRLSTLTRHLLSLFQGQPGAKQWRREISEAAHKPRAGLEVLERALSYVDG